MSIGLIGLLDDVASLAKVAAASLDDAVGQAARAGSKAVGVVIDDTAVTPTYVTGFDASRELPMIGKIAAGSVRNKLLYLLPVALLLSWAAPWAITPLLMLGGAYLCFEGAEKVGGMLRGHGGHGAEDAGASEGLENRKVRSAIQTDFILSAEIMAVTLGSVATQPIWEQAVVLAIVGLGITALVYGVVALIVKADDAGVALARQDAPMTRLLRLGRGRGAAPPSGVDRVVRPVTQAVGRGLVTGMPALLQVLSVVGTAAMVWVGGGIVIHGLEQYGVTEPGHTLEQWAAMTAGLMPVGAPPAVGAVLDWAVFAAGSGVLGLLIGGMLLLAMEFAVMPVWRRVRRRQGAGPGKPGCDAADRQENVW